MAPPKGKTNAKDNKAAEDALAQEQENQKPVVAHGSFAFLDGSTYVGDFSIANELPIGRQGHGKCNYGHESYDGEWENDKMHGQGIYKFATGAIYEGGFQDNLMHGQGKYQWPDGAVYEGGWIHNRMHGEGKYTDKEGVVWEGSFCNGKYDSGEFYHHVR